MGGGVIPCCSEATAGVVWPKGKVSPVNQGDSMRIVFTPIVKTASVEMLNVPAVIVEFESTA